MAHQVEPAKIALSADDEATLRLDAFAPGEMHTLSRLKFELASTQLVKEIESTVASLLPTAGIAAERIDTVFFTGGSSGIPALRERIAAQLPKAVAVDAARRFG